MIAILPHVLEATRLVRAGRLTEATALLRGETPMAARETPKPQPATGKQQRKDGTSATRPAIPPGVSFEEHIFRSAHGSRPYKLYIPSTRSKRAIPLIVMLHGCTQSPDDFAAGTRMNVHAEKNGFLVVYPSQTRAANASGCWNWFQSKDQRRDSGEPAIVAGIVADVIQAHDVDPSRIFVAGLSAGGAAAATLGVLYPDVFAAIGVHSGLACGAAHDLPSALAAMQRGAIRSGDLVHKRSVPAIIFHGDGDATVNLANADQISAQTEGLALEVIDTGVSAGGKTFTRAIGLNDVEDIVLERWIVHGGGHAWFGGSPEGSYTDPSGPDASEEMVRFFLDQADKKIAGDDVSA